MKKPFLTSPPASHPCVAVTLQAEVKHAFTSITNPSESSKNIQWWKSEHKSYNSEPWGDISMTMTKIIRRDRSLFRNVNLTHLSFSLSNHIPYITKQLNLHIGGSPGSIYDDSGETITHVCQPVYCNNQWSNTYKVSLLSHISFHES